MKKSIFFNFSIFVPKWGPFGVGMKNIFFTIFQNFQNFFWKMASMGPIECWMKQSHEIWAHLGHPLRSHKLSSTCRAQSASPCSIHWKGLQWNYSGTTVIWLWSIFDYSGPLYALFGYTELKVNDCSYYSHLNAFTFTVKWM